jgi:hypothetical protein
MCSHTRGQEATPTLHWDSQPIAKIISARFLGLRLELDLFWTVQIATAL